MNFYRMCIAYAFRPELSLMGAKPRPKALQGDGHTVEIPVTTAEHLSL